jgi:hypothetical protein
MSYDVHRWDLPPEAGRIDRSTLVLWKWWTEWHRPLLVGLLVMGLVSAVVGRVIAGSGGFVAPWTPTNYAAAVAPGQSLIDANGGAWTRGIIAQAFASLLAVVAFRPIARRSRRALPIGVIAGFGVTVVHLTVSHQWTVRPIVGAGAGYQAAALVVLWCLPILAAGAAVIARKTSTR